MAPQGERSLDRSRDRSRASEPTGSIFVPFKKAYCVTSFGCLMITMAASVALIIVGIQGDNGAVTIAGVVVGILFITLIVWYASLCKKRKQEAEDAAENARMAASFQNLNHNLPGLPRRENCSDILTPPPYSRGGVYTIDINTGIAYSIPPEYVPGCHSNMAYIIEAPPPYGGLPPPSYDDVIKETQPQELTLVVANTR
eukprot:GHVR01081090.1.p1 GENE.GHVR01081090.1~~GHVR01081090.1.p1  ORF type:complete len:199 (-),score=10.52 GHVR01081090.1:910-1506(-)